MTNKLFRTLERRRRARSLLKNWLKIVGFMTALAASLLALIYSLAQIVAWAEEQGPIAVFIVLAVIVGVLVGTGITLVARDVLD